MQQNLQSSDPLAIDSLRVRRFQREPGIGPKILFFSGGTALRGVSRCLKGYTHNSVHLLTPFDSGGSSAKLRDAFNMPAVGDIRSRLVALADASGNSEKAALKLVEYRLPESEDSVSLREELAAIQGGQHRLLKSVSSLVSSWIREHLAYFMNAMPVDFDLRGACVGNLILAGGYLHYDRRLEPCLHVLARILGVKGLVSPITQEPFHLAVRLAGGERYIGQHLVAGKETKPIASPVVECGLSASVDEWLPVSAPLSANLRQLIEEADLIVFPPGSFYSSVVANLLVSGVAQAIMRSVAPKVYVPNLGCDPEQLGMDLPGCVERLIDTLRLECPPSTQASQVLTHVLMDKQASRYKGCLNDEEWRNKGLNILRHSLASKQSGPYYDEKSLCEALLSLASVNSTGYSDSA